MKFKICGMKYSENIRKTATLLQPDYLGFIFYGLSPRLFTARIPKLPETVKKTGVFVDESFENIMTAVNTHGLQMVQLHGSETPDLCKQIKNQGIGVIKVFSVKNSFDFSVMEPYEQACDFYMFDTKGIYPGGNSYAFDWKVLKGYPYKKPFFLSGGIGLDMLSDVNRFLRSRQAEYCHAIDVNSKFEVKPGLKSVDKLTDFKQKLFI